MNESRIAKFERLQELILDTYIDALEKGEVDIKDLSSAVVFLKNNGVKEEKIIKTEAELLDELIEPA